MKKMDIPPAVSRWLSAEGLAPLLGDEAGPDELHACAPRRSDILIFCHPRTVVFLAHTFEEMLRVGGDRLPFSQVWEGKTSERHLGVVGLLWWGPLDQAFLRRIGRDHEVFDYLVYSWEAGEPENKPPLCDPRELLEIWAQVRGRAWRNGESHAQAEK